MLCLIRIKACKRCKGDVSLEVDAYGAYAECIQCGATWYQKASKLNFTSEPETSLQSQETEFPVVTDLVATPTSQGTKKITGK